MEYRILRTPNFYAGALNAPQPDVLRQDADGYTINPMAPPAEFRTETDAQAEIDHLDGAVYRLEDGEAGRPDYTII